MLGYPERWITLDRFDGIHWGVVAKIGFCKSIIRGLVRHRSYRVFWMLTLHYGVENPVLD